MRAVESLRRDPGLAFVIFAMLAAAAVYAPTLGRGLVNYDDPWLVRDNWILQQFTVSSLRTILLDLDSPQRFVLTPEYLPVRDLSIMLDFALWGDWYPGFHLTNLIVYIASIALWFAALDAFGIDRKIAGIAVLLWALHPTHAESVAWVTERKGLLAMMFAGVCALGYARFRAGGSARWLAFATVAGVFAVWSKATGAFAVASLAALELVVPGRRVSWRRSLVGLATIGAVTVIAFVPVLILARRWSVVGGDVQAPVGRVASVLGVHGFYLGAAAMLVRNAVSYPIASAGPSPVDLAVGGLGLIALVLVLMWPRTWRWAPVPEVRAGAALWCVGWLPVSHLILPLQMVYVADRYMLFPTLGIALCVAAAIVRVRRESLRRALLSVLAISASIRTLDAQAAWRDPETLWRRAVASNPADGSAWAMYVEAVVAGSNGTVRAEAIVEEGLRHTRSARLVHRQALLALPRDRARGLQLMRDAAERGEPIAMSNLALLLLEAGLHDEALLWARRGSASRPTTHAQRTLGKVALAAGRATEALDAFRHAYALDPASCANRINLALAMRTSGRSGEAIPLLESCARDPTLGRRARSELATLRGVAP